MKSKILFLVGPTAVGKSRVAVCLARRLKAQIISCDSMQIYRGMDIITSKPARPLRRGIRHYLIDLVRPSQEYNVSRYRKEALEKIKAVLKKGKIPLFVGGTGLYMSVLIDGIFKQKSQDKFIRKRLWGQALRLGGGYLYKRLKKIDPEAADKIHPHDTRRIIRALEVFEATGSPISRLQKQRQGLGAEFEIKAFCLGMRRDRLYRKIDERVEKMFSRGLVAEVKKLLKCRLSKTASSAIGIKELKGYFDGLYGLEEAKRLIKRNTRRYAKRQLTWFRKDKRLRWVKITDKEGPETIAGKIWKKLY